jgi:hypothetical protein
MLYVSSFPLVPGSTMLTMPQGVNIAGFDFGCSTDVSLSAAVACGTSHVVICWDMTMSPTSPHPLLHSAVQMELVK